MRRLTVGMAIVAFLGLSAALTAVSLDVAHTSAELSAARREATGVRAEATRLGGVVGVTSASLARTQRRVLALSKRVAQLASAWNRVVGPYPRGAFDWCPSVGGTRPVTSVAGQSAIQAAKRFDAALHQSSQQALARLVDPTIAQHASPYLPNPSTTVLDPGYWFKTRLASHLQVENTMKTGLGGGTGPADHNPMVLFGCGPRVAARGLQVTLQDHSHTSDSRTTFFLVRRFHGWKVWGSY